MLYGVEREFSGLSRRGCCLRPGYWSGRTFNLIRNVVEGRGRRGTSSDGRVGKTTKGIVRDVSTQVKEVVRGSRRRHCGRSVNVVELLLLLLRLEVHTSNFLPLVAERKVTAALLVAKQGVNVRRLGLLLLLLLRLLDIQGRISLLLHRLSSSQGRVVELSYQQKQNKKRASACEREQYDWKSRLARSLTHIELVTLTPIKERIRILGIVGGVGGLLLGCVEDDLRFC